MPPRGNSLRDEARPVEELGLRALPEFVCCEAVAVCREGFGHGRVGVGCTEPGVCVDVVLYACDTGVEGFGDKEVCAR